MLDKGLPASHVTHTSLTCCPFLLRALLACLAFARSVSHSVTHPSSEALWRAEPRHLPDMSFLYGGQAVSLQSALKCLQVKCFPNGQHRAHGQLKSVLVLGLHYLVFVAGMVLKLFCLTKCVRQPSIALHQGSTQRKVRGTWNVQGVKEDLQSGALTLTEADRQHVPRAQRGASLTTPTFVLWLTQVRPHQHTLLWSQQRPPTQRTCIAVHCSAARCQQTPSSMAAVRLVSWCWCRIRARHYALLCHCHHSQPALLLAAAAAISSSAAASTLATTPERQWPCDAHHLGHIELLGAQPCGTVCGAAACAISYVASTF